MNRVGTMTARSGVAALRRPTTSCHCRLPQDRPAAGGASTCWRRTASSASSPAALESSSVPPPRQQQQRQERWKGPLPPSMFQRRAPPQQQQQPPTTATAQRRPFHSTVPAGHLTNKDEVAARPTEEERNETDETVPVWANPLHHNNPDFASKMFAEDFADGEELEGAVLPLPPLETVPSKVVAPPHIHRLADAVVHLNLLELRELTDKIAAHFGFDSDMMAASYGGGGGGGGSGPSSAGGEEEAAAVEEAKTIFDLRLVGFDAKAKIKVIKEVRAIAGLGLKEAKELVEAAPKVVQKGLKQDKAEELKALLEAAGAVVEIV